MRPGAACAATALVLVTAAACRTRESAPAQVTQHYRSLVDSLDPEAPGAAVVALRAFARDSRRYEIVAAVETDIQTWRARLDPAYLKARELVRQEQFDRAERMLADLARLEDEQAGRRAREFLRFEFHHTKAQRLLAKGDTAGAHAVLEALVRQRLSDEEMAAAQRLLDGAGLAEIGARMTRTTALRSAVRSLQVCLYASYADDGRYPETLTLDSPVFASLRGSGTLDPIASIEGYTSTADTFSFVAVAKGSGQRVRVTNTGIE